MSLKRWHVLQPRSRCMKVKHPWSTALKLVPKVPRLSLLAHAVLHIVYLAGNERKDRDRDGDEPNERPRRFTCKALASDALTIPGRTRRGCCRWSRGSFLHVRSRCKENNPIQQSLRQVVKQGLHLHVSNRLQCNQDTLFFLQVVGSRTPVLFRARSASRGQCIPNTERNHVTN